MPAKPIDAEVRRHIAETLHETNGNLREAERLLKSRGVKTSFGSIRNVRVDEESEIDSAARLSAAEARIRSQNGSINWLKRKLGDVLNFNDEVLGAIPTLPVLSKTQLKVPKSVKSSTEMSVVLLWSDWHIGEIIKSVQTEGCNEYSYAIAEARALKLVEYVLAWTETHRHGYAIPDIHILALGDFVSGDLRDEHRATNEFPSPVALVKAAYLMARCTAMLAGSFRHVYFHQILADNHARMTKKPQSKDKALNSLNYPLYTICNESLSKHDNITFDTRESARAQFDVNGQSVLCDHGDTVRSWLGIPYYGMQREDGAEATKRLAMPVHEPFDLRIRGHWHYAAVGPFGIINGALCGMTEYDYLSARFAPPSQVSFLMHPKHGFFDWTRWKLPVNPVTP